MKVVLLAAALLGMTGGALADTGARPLALSGSIGALAWHTDDPLVRRGSGAGARLRLEASGGAGPFRGALRADLASAPDMADTRGTSRLREAWLRYRGSSADLTLGRQLLPSGRTDVIVLQDQFAPRDLRQLALTEAEQQFGLTALRLDLYLSDVWSATAAVIRQDRAYVLPRRIAQALPDGPDLAEEAADAGLLRIEYRAGSVEFAATLAHGASPLPGVTLASGAPRAVHPREDRLAFDGALGLGAHVLRWDLVHARAETDALPGFSRRRTAAALSWDRGLWRDANLSVQAIFRHDVLAQPPAAGSALRPLFDANRRLSQAFRPNQRFLTVTVKQRVRTRHQLEAGLLAGTEHQRAFIGRWVWQLQDRLALHAKVQHMRGADDSLVGSLGYEKGLHAELQYQF